MNSDKFSRSVTALLRSLIQIKNSVPQHAEVTEGLTPRNHTVILKESRDQPADRMQNLESMMQQPPVSEVNPVIQEQRDLEVAFSADMRHPSANMHSTDRERRSDCQYSSIGPIPQLPRDRTRHEAPSANIGGQIKSFNHPSTKFSGEGDPAENLGAYHQSFMNLCRSFNLTEKEAFANLYILFPTGSQAGRFYHKHVLKKARSLDEAFKMLYSRFMSNERRDRLLYQWNNLNFADFMKKSIAIKQSALRNLCSTASSIQLQLGASYQDPQHLRDALSTACKNEKWTHRLSTIPTNDLLDIEVSLARAITAQDNLDRFTRNVIAAYGNEVNFNDDDVNAINFTSDRPGMPYRRFGSDRRFDKWNDTTREPMKPYDEKIRLGIFAYFSVVCAFPTVISFVIALNLPQQTCSDRKACLRC